MSQSLLIYLAVVVVAVLATNANSSPNAVYAKANNKSHHLIVGYRLPGDRLVIRQNISKKSSWMKVVTTSQIFNTTRNERITLVQALDQKVNGNGAYASLLKGGPGHSNVTLRFKSQRGHGINFVVEIYARP